MNDRFGDLTIIPENDLNPINEEDEIFATDISKKYNLFYEDISLLARSFRYTTSVGLPDYLLNDCEDAELKLKYQQVLIHSVIKSIVFETDKGCMTVLSSDPFFQLFESAISKTIRKIDKSITSDKQKAKDFLESCCIMDILTYLKGNYTLTFNNILIITGLFLAHFKIYKSKPILKRDEYSDIDFAALDYEHYLIDRVKTIFEYLPGHFIIK